MTTRPPALDLAHGRTALTRPRYRPAPYSGSRHHGSVVSHHVPGPGGSPNDGEAAGVCPSPDASSALLSMSDVQPLIHHFIYQLKHR
ncbi:unnamed protein product [Urochloa humidicola]